MPNVIVRCEIFMYLDSRNWAYLTILICHTKGSGKRKEQKRNVQWHWFMIVLSTAKNFVFVSEGKTGGHVGDASQKIQILFKAKFLNLWKYKIFIIIPLLTYQHITSPRSTPVVEKAEKFRKVKYLALKFFFVSFPFLVPCCCLFSNSSWLML